jgi:hypothetical protein
MTRVGAHFSLEYPIDGLRHVYCCPMGGCPFDESSLEVL